VRPGEKPEVAARRELWEEIGVRAHALQFAGIVCEIWDGRPDRVHVFELWLRDLPTLRLDHREIIGAALVEPSELSSMKLTGPVLAYVETRTQPVSPG
jgi:8-oxo-dGTP pyrophosphatase MutT (NUDIX family)